MKSLLLVSDFDDTLVGNAIKDVDSHTTTFKTVWERSRASGINCKLAINTGRCVDLPAPVLGPKDIAAQITNRRSAAAAVAEITNLRIPKLSSPV